MAKGHRHLKKLKSEKAKVKLKGSKHLPKGTNVTDTSFKIKQIVVREQLKAANSIEPLSKRKLNIKELLSRLQHYNTSVRTGAISDLKDLVTHYPADIVVPNLCQLIQGVSHLVLDREKSVRRDSLMLITLILSQVTVEQMAPFFAILSSYFRCAMTHIDPAIQEDSLLLLDVLLTFSPSLVAKDSNKILENFFDLISKLRSDAKPGRTLTVNLGSQITTVKWRVKVLNRLYCMLDAIINEKSKNDCAHVNHSVVKTIKYNAEQHSYIPIYNNNLMPCLLNLNNLSNQKNINAVDNEYNIIKYIDILVPLLFETWLEVGPNKKEDSKIDVTLTEEATSVLHCILNILQLLHRFLNIYSKDTGDLETLDKFVMKYGKDFSNFIFSNFPYTQSVSRKRKKTDKEKSKSMESFCISENLMICHLFCIFNKKIGNNKIQKQYAEKMLNYVQNIFTLWNPENENQNKQILIVLKCLLLEISKTWTIYSDTLSNILNTAIILYNDKKISGNLKCDLFNILCEIVKYDNLSRIPQFQTWLSTLPDLLCQSEISEKIVDMISFLTKQKNTLFIKALENKFDNILSNVNKIKIIDSDDTVSVKCKIIGLIYYIPIDSNFDCIKNFLQNGDSLLKGYLKEILTIKYEQSNDFKRLSKLKDFIWM